MSVKLTTMRSRRFTPSVVHALVCCAVAFFFVTPTNAVAGMSESCARRPNTGVLSLLVAAESVPPGQTVRFQVDKSTGPTIMYGVDYSVQQCVAGVWMLAPFSPELFTRQRIQQSGHAGSWWNAPIPGDAVPGEYRIRKSVWDGGYWHRLYGEFEVAVQPGID